MKSVHENRARNLLLDIEAWCTRTGVAESALGAVLFKFPGFVGLLRTRLLVTEPKVQAVREFIMANPDGYGGDFPKCRVRSPRRDRHNLPFKMGSTSDLGWRIMAEAMEAAVRKLDGLEEFKLPEGVARACVVDGRWYPEFLTDLIERGLRDWFSDRAQRGEPVL